MDVHLQMNLIPLFPQGVIDVDKEIGKLETKKDSLGKQLKKLEDAAAVPTYETKVPEDVRNKNAEKVIVLVIFRLLPSGIATIIILIILLLCVIWVIVLVIFRLLPSGIATIILIILLLCVIFVSMSLAVEPSLIKSWTAELVKMILVCPVHKEMRHSKHSPLTTGLWPLSCYQ